MVGFGGRSDRTILIFDLIGGLGNQLFVAACAKAVAQRGVMDAQLNSSEIDKTKIPSFTTLVGDVFSSEVTNNGSPSKWDRCVDRLFQSRDLQTRLWATSGRYINFGDRHSYVEPSFLEGLSRARGYFQTSSYLDALLEKPHLPFEMQADTPAYLKMLNRFNEGNILGVHVRRGDYHSHKSSIGMLTNSYFEKAVFDEFYEGNYEQIWVFSNDPGLKLSIPNSLDVQIASRLSLSDGQQFRLMSLCKGLVISNSSFSWWAANISSTGRQSVGTVIAPGNWYRSLEWDPKLLRPDWKIRASQWLA